MIILNNRTPKENEKLRKFIKKMKIPKKLDLHFYYNLNFSY